MTGKQWFAVIANLAFGQKLVVDYLNAKGKSCCWNGLRLIPATTVCNKCGQDWHIAKENGEKLDKAETKRRMAFLLRGECYHCGAGNQPKVSEAPVKSKGFFNGKAMESLHFRVGTSSGMIRTVCVDSLLADPKAK
jgi:hypothetical protein